jgi:hypothetical protein
LGDVSAHCKQSLQRFGPKGGNQTGGPTAERSEIRARRASQLLRDLKQVADDHLVVRGGSAMLVYCLCQNGRLRRGGLCLL